MSQNNQYDVRDGKAWFNNGIEKIEDSAFEGRKDLIEVVIPASVTHVGNAAFKYCGNLKSVTFENATAKIQFGEACFASCTALESVVLPTSTVAIGKSCFQYCSALKSIVLSDKIEEIPENAFNSCFSLTSINTGLSVRKVGKSAFVWCKALESIDFGENLKEIGDECFVHCGRLRNLPLPSELENMGRYSFGHCDNLKTLEIPRGIKYFGPLPFDPNDGLFSANTIGNTLNLPASTEIILPLWGDVEKKMVQCRAVMDKIYQDYEIDPDKAKDRRAPILRDLDQTLRRFPEQKLRELSDSELESVIIKTALTLYKTYP